MKKRFKIFLILLFPVIFIITLFYFLTGLYVVPKYQLATSCDTCESFFTGENAATIWYRRFGMDISFITSDGGMLIKMKKEGLSLFERIRKTDETRKHIRSRAILHLPYMEFLYRLSAEGRPPVKYDTAF